MLKKSVFVLLLISLSLVGCRNIETRVIDFSEPELVLTDYFKAMENHDINKLIKYYGGSYEFFGEIDPKNKNEALTNYLTSIPTLHLNQILKRKKVSDNEYEFVVNFAVSTGEIFMTKTTTSSNSEFTYPVKKIGDKFLVMGLPPYQA